ncbi:S8 family serine peptidase [Haloarchaeobius amylolyticus]|uniref:S8 family serine peptidase n=1 Tax=Haloarchaeobius amylolyticus TaxID=1198296 RepID=UPI0022702AFC|nr:S8 family serine peptidase [Haloarchaeobius amylolyticus]
MVKHTRRDVLKLSGGVLGGIAVGSTVTAAESTDRFIVKADADELGGDLSVVHAMDPVDFTVVEGPESALDAAGVDYAPDVEIELDRPEMKQDVGAELEDEPLYPLQWGKEAQNVPEAHEVTRGEGTRVAIVDTGVAAGHPDLEHAVNEDLSQDFTGDGYGAAGPYGGYHGTHVAGIVAANDKNEAGVAGTAPATEIVDCRVFSPSALASFADIVAAAVYAAEIGCDVANMSIGAYPVSRKGIGSFYGKVLNATMAYGRRQGTLYVVSAGNDAADLQHDGRVCVENDDGTTDCFPAISLPNEAANVMSISATGPIGFGWGDDGLEEPPTTPANYTNYGTNAIDVSAPGGNYDPEAAANDVPGWYYDLVLNTVAIPSFDDDGNYLGADYSYSWVAGTSMAAPNVAGAAALVASQQEKTSANKVRNVLRRTARDVGDKPYHGSGFVDVEAAVTD